MFDARAEPRHVGATLRLIQAAARTARDDMRAPIPVAVAAQLAEAAEGVARVGMLSDEAGDGGGHG